MGGKQTIRGLRVTVGAIARIVTSGYASEIILGMYPYLEREDITQALEYTSWRTDEPKQSIQRPAMKFSNRSGQVIKDLPMSFVMSILKVYLFETTL